MLLTFLFHLDTSILFAPKHEFNMQESNEVEQNHDLYLIKILIRRKT